MQRKVPLPGRILARCILRRRFAGHFGCMARISCQSQPVFGCMARESCRELAIFPSEATFGMHGAKKLPRIAARERISRAFCHRRTPGDASRHNLATTGRPRRTLRAPMRYDTMRHDAMRRSATTPPATAPRRHAPYAALLSPLKSKLRVTGVNEVKRTTCFGLSAIVSLTY